MVVRERLWAKSGSVPDPIGLQLLPGETVVWRGAPRRGLMLAVGDVFYIPFSLVWCGVTVSMEVSAIRKGRLDFSTVFATLFVVVGLFMVFGRFMLDAWLRRQTIYALTDRRILIVRSGLWSSLTALQLANLPEAVLTGRGTIRFGRPASPSRGSNAFGTEGLVPSLDPTPQFLGIADAQQVFTMVQKRVNRSQTA